MRFALPFVALVALSGCGGSKDGLRLNVRNGQTMAYESSESIQVEVDGPQGQAVEDWKLTKRLVHEFKERESSLQKVMVRFDDVQIETRPMQSEETGPLIDFGQAVYMVDGMEVDMSVSPSGQTRSYLARPREEATVTGEATIAAETALLREVGLYGLRFPSGPITKGMTWTEEVDMQTSVIDASAKSVAPSTAKMTISSTITELTGDTVTIERVTDGTMEFVLGIAGVEGDGQSSFTDTAQMEFDRGTGVLKKSTSQGESEIDFGFLLLKIKKETSSVLQSGLN